MPDERDAPPAGNDGADEDWFGRVREALSPGPAGTLAGFEILEEAGAGSQGRVFRARQPGTGRLVAIKRLREGTLARGAAVARFRREVELAASLRHPGIVTVHGLVEDAGGPALVMEWVEGQPIDAWADAIRAGPGGVRRMVEAARVAAEAVAEAHGRGVLHRDLKPSNILVDAEDRPRILDFGLARALDGGEVLTMTRDGGFAGTPAYASPEQLEGRSRDLDVRADVYALGGVLHRMLTGAPPVDPDQGLSGLVDTVRSGRVARPSSLNPGVNAELDAIVRKAMDPERERRYATAAGMAEDLARWLDGRAVLAHGPGTLYLARAFVRRHRWPVAAGATALLAVVGGGIVSGVLAAQLSIRGQRLSAALREKQTALTEAQIQRDRATREVLKQQAARAFLTELLGDLRGGADGAAAPTVLEALDRRAARLETRTMPLEPDIEAVVRATAGELYRWLGAPDRAIPQFEAAATVLEPVPGLGRDLADVLSMLGQSRLDAGDAPGSAAEFARSVELMERAAVDPGDVDIARLSLVRALIAAGRVDEAEVLLARIGLQTDPFYQGRVSELREALRLRRAESLR